MDLRLASVRSGIAVTATSLVVRILQIVSTVILARLLDPSDFGLMALANILLAGLAIFTTLGLTQALIATTEDRVLAAFHTFLMTAVAGILLTILMFAVAEEYSVFYETPELMSLCQVMALILFFQALRIVPDALLMKQMRFGRRVVPTIVASLGGVTVSLTMAFLGFGVWSLAAGALTTAFLQSVGIALVCPEWGWFRMHPWDNAMAKRLLRFGSRNVSTWLVQYFYNNIDHLIVGKTLGPKQLGFYSQGFSLSNMAVTSVSTVINSVLLPAYSKIAQDRERLARAYLKSFQMVAVVTVPMAMGIFVVAPEAVIVLIGEKWREAIPVLQVFAFMTLVRPLSGSTSPLFLSLERPQYNLRTALVQAASLAVLIFLFLDWGIPGVAFAVVCAFVLGFVHNIYLVCQKTDLPITLRAMARALLPSFVAGCLMLLSVSLMKFALAHWLGNSENVTTLVSLIVTGMVSYAAFLFFVERRLFLEILDLAKSAISRRAEAPGT